MIVNKQRFHLNFSVSFLLVLCSVNLDALDNTNLHALHSLADRKEIIDSNQVNACLQLAKHYLYDSTEIAAKYAKKGIRVASEISHGAGKGKCQNLLALAHEIQGYMVEALIIYEEAYQTMAEAGKIEDAAGIITNMGVAHYYSGNRGEALKYYLRALQYTRENSLQHHESKLLNNIAVIYRELKQFDDAIRMYNQSSQLKLELSDSLGYAQTRENLGLAYSYLDQGDLAIEYLNEAISWYKSLGQEADAIQAQLSLSNIYIKLHRIEDAQQILDWLVDESQTRLLPHYKAAAYLMQARLLMIKQENIPALEALDTGYRLIEGSDRNELLAQYLALFAAIYEELEEYQVALRYTQKRIMLLDTLNQKDRLETEREMKAKLDLQEKEAQIIVQEQKLLQQTRERQWFFSLLAISFLLLALLALFAYFKARSNKQLREKNLIIDKSLKEKEILLKEIHHRVKNNLQVVSSLLSLQARSLKGQEALEALAKGKDRVRSMALIHQNLYQGENLSAVNSKEYIDRLCKSLLQTYNVGSGRIKLHTDVQALMLDIDTVIPLGLILNELITNAIKYAFKPDARGEISISLARHEETLELIVADNGVGMSMEDLGDQQTMGFRLVKSFVQKLKGTYNITIEQGTKVSFRFSSFRMASVV
ncbi:MAG: tetratricopeptide repeat protein [Saprospiraceae bacterium]|nr:tetratricopeptide repeat protein [Saprospiraceae bacterium]